MSTVNLAPQVQTLLGLTQPSIDPDVLRANVDQAVQRGQLSPDQAQQILASTLDRVAAAGGDNWREKLGLASGGSTAAQGVTPVSGFQPASDMRYECTIHSFTMKDAATGKRYYVMLDLIRADQNPQWGVGEDRSAIRAKIWDAQTGQLVAEKLTEEPRAQFARDVGDLHLLDAQGDMGFQSPDLSFQFHVTPGQGNAVQGASAAIRDQLESSLAGMSDAQRQQVLSRFPMQLLVTDYPVAHETGTLTATTQDGQTLSLTAQDAPATFSHHYGNTLPPYAYMATIPQDGKDRFVAVLGDIGVDLDPSKAGAEANIPVGYYIHTDAQGHSDYGLLRYNVKQHGPGAFSVGSDLFGKAVEVSMGSDVKDGQVSLTNLDTHIGLGQGRLVTRLFGQDVSATDAQPMIVDLGGPLARDAGAAG